MSNQLKKNKNLLQKTNGKKSNSNKQKKQSKSSLHYQDVPNNLDTNKTQQKSYNWEIIITKPSPSRKSISTIHSSDTDNTETSSSTSTQNSPIPVRVRSRTRSPHPAQKRKSESEHKSNRSQDVKLPQKESKTEHHLNYTNQDALNWLKNKIAEQTTTQKKNKETSVSTLNQSSYALLAPQKFGYLFLNEQNDKVTIRMHETTPQFTTKEQEKMEHFYQESHTHHFDTHDYVNPTKQTFLRCPSPLCHYNIINTTNINKHIHKHCSLFHHQTPLIYEYQDNNEWIQIEYQPIENPAS